MRALCGVDRTRERQGLLRRDLALVRIEILPRGTRLVIGEHPLDDRRQRALTRYYRDAGSGGVAVAVHTTQFAIRERGLLRPVLELAAQEGETLVDDALRMLLGSEGKLTAEAVQQMIQRQEAVPEVTAVSVADVDLSSFDQLLEDREVWSDDSQGSENDVDGAVTSVAFAGVP